MRPFSRVLVLALACGGCSTSPRIGATEYPLGPRGVEIVTASRPYVLPPIFKMAAAYCARYGGSPTLSSVHKTVFGSLVNTYSCGAAQPDADGSPAPEPAAPSSR